MLPLSLLSPLGQTKIYLYAKPADMRNYAARAFMRSWSVSNVTGGDRAAMVLCIILILSGWPQHGQEPIGGSELPASQRRRSACFQCFELFTRVCT